MKFDRLKLNFFGTNDIKNLSKNVCCNKQRLRLPNNIHKEANDSLLVQVILLTKRSRTFIFFLLHLSFFFSPSLFRVIKTYDRKKYKKYEHEIDFFGSSDDHSNKQRMCLGCRAKTTQKFYIIHIFLLSCVLKCFFFFCYSSPLLNTNTKYFRSC